MLQCFVLFKCFSTMAIRLSVLTSAMQLFFKIFILKKKSKSREGSLFCFYLYFLMFLFIVLFNSSTIRQRIFSCACLSAIHFTKKGIFRSVMALKLNFRLLLNQCFFYYLKHSKGGCRGCCFFFFKY